MFWSCHSFACRQLCCYSACKMVAWQSWLNYEKKDDAQSIFTRFESWAHKLFVTRPQETKPPASAHPFLNGRALALSDIHLRPRSRKIFFAYNFYLNVQLFWKFAQSRGMILPCAAQDFKMVWHLMWMIWTNKILESLSFDKSFGWISHVATGSVCGIHHTIGLWAYDWNLQLINFF